jgi:hypothetical protein
MPYGQGGRLGDSIDPRLMMADFSGFERAGAIQGQTLSNIGKDIGEVLKMRNEKDSFVKTTIQTANAIKKSLPHLAPVVEDALLGMTDDNASLNDRFDLAQSIQRSLDVALTGQQERRADSMLDLEWAKLQAAKDNAAGSGGWGKNLKFVDVPDGMGGAVMMAVTPSGLIPAADLMVRQPDGFNEAQFDEDPLTKQLGKNIQPQVAQDETESVQSALRSLATGSVSPSLGVLQDIGAAILRQGATPPATPVAVPKTPRFGYTPSKTNEWRDATPQELKKFGVKSGQINTATHEFRVIDKGGDEATVAEKNAEARINALNEVNKLFESGDIRGAYMLAKAKKVLRQDSMMGGEQDMDGFVQDMLELQNAPSGNVLDEIRASLK